MPTKSPFIAVIALLAAAAAIPSRSAETAIPSTDRPGNGQPWMNRSLTPDARAALVIRAMTNEEKLDLVLGTSQRPAGDAIGVAGAVRGVPRLGLPPLRETNAELGVAIPLQGEAIRPEDEATALPSGLATAASWDKRIAYANGAMIGNEARRKGFNVLLAGAVNLTRDPRGGRNFEYAGEDPLLAGTMVGEAIRGIADQHIISTIKHFALNDQETNRTLLDARIDTAALRQSDLLAFELAMERGHPGSVMCSYNLINGVHACESDWLLQKVLRQDWGFPGWVMSDWGAVHSTVAAARAGLDQESGADWDSQAFFGKPLGDAIAEGSLPRAQLDLMATRILRTMFASGIIDDPPKPAPLDAAADRLVAERAETAGIVLLRNQHQVLPLSPRIGSIAVIGGHADTGVISGGGSSQVIPIGGPAPLIDLNHRDRTIPFPMIFDPSSPLRAIAAAAPQARVAYADGRDPAAAARLAHGADAAIVFATQWQLEGHDVQNLSLPRDQDQLIAAVAAANPRTIVVLETGDPVLMPWRDKVAAILEAWYPGSGGGQAIAQILFGQADPSGHLPITFPAGIDQLPRPALDGRHIAWNTNFPVDYREGAEIGYRWFALRHLQPLFPFGFGLSYTQFRYAALHLKGSKSLAADFVVTNVGHRAGAAVPQLYARVTLPHGAIGQRLVGWSKLNLAPGESRRVRIAIDPRLLAGFDEAAGHWTIVGGRYAVALGESSEDVRLTGSIRLAPAILPP